VIDVFPAHQQTQIRTQLSMVLEGIVCQSLLPRADGRGRVVAVEVLIPTPAIRNLIREDKVHQIYALMQAGQEKIGTQTLNQSLASSTTPGDHARNGARTSSLRDELTDMINRASAVPERDERAARRRTAPHRDHGARR
jgi:twitching motility protein PilT